MERWILGKPCMMSRCPWVGESPSLKEAELLSWQRLLGGFWDLIGPQNSNQSSHSQHCVLFLLIIKILFSWSDLFPLAVFRKYSFYTVLLSMRISNFLCFLPLVCIRYNMSAYFSTVKHCHYLPVFFPLLPLLLIPPSLSFSFAVLMNLFSYQPLRNGPGNVIILHWK